MVSIFPAFLTSKRIKYKIDRTSFLIRSALNPFHDGSIVGGLDELLELGRVDGGKITGRGGGGSGRSSGLRLGGTATDLGLDDGAEDKDTVSREDGAGD